MVPTLVLYDSIMAIQTSSVLLQNPKKDDNRRTRCCYQYYYDKYSIEYIENLQLRKGCSPNFNVRTADLTLVSMNVAGDSDSLSFCFSGAAILALRGATF